MWVFIAGSIHFIFLNTFVLVVGVVLLCFINVVKNRDGASMSAGSAARTFSSVVALTRFPSVEDVRTVYSKKGD